MITNFRGFGPIHLLSLFAAILLGTAFIIWGIKAGTDEKRRLVRLLLTITIILIRGARYIMDICFGVFEWSDLLSLHICHVDLILLAICLIKPNRTLFSICFLVGIPTALAVALFPGTNHPAPGVPRAVLFIMSHAMLVMGALFLSIAERMKPTLRQYGLLAVIGSAGLIPVYLINRWLGTNYLYIMEAPKGTALAAFEKVFGWPGYVLALDALALLLMLLMLGLGQTIFRITEKARLKKITNRS